MEVQRNLQTLNPNPLTQSIPVGMERSSLDILMKRISATIDAWSKENAHLFQDATLALTDKAKLLCDKFATKGTETILVGVNVSDCTAFQLGSKHGLNFLNHRSEILSDFVQFSKDSTLKVNTGVRYERLPIHHGAGGSSVSSGISQTGVLPNRIEERGVSRVGNIATPDTLHDGRIERRNEEPSTVSMTSADTAHKNAVSTVSSETPLRIVSIQSLKEEPLSDEEGMCTGTDDTEVQQESVSVKNDKLEACRGQLSNSGDAHAVSDVMSASQSVNTSSVKNSNSISNVVPENRISGTGDSNHTSGHPSNVSTPLVTCRLVPVRMKYLIVPTSTSSEGAVPTSTSSEGVVPTSTSSEGAAEPSRPKLSAPNPLLAGMISGDEHSRICATSEQSDKEIDEGSKQSGGHREPPDARQRGLVGKRKATEEVENSATKLRKERMNQMTAVSLDERRDDLVLLNIQPTNVQQGTSELSSVIAENVSHQSDSTAAYFQEKTREHRELLRVTRDARKRFPFKNLNDDQGFQAQNYVFNQLPHLFPWRRKVLELLRINNKSFQYRKRARLRYKANQELSDGENVPPKRSTSTDIISESSSVSEVQLQVETSSSSSEIPQQECSEGTSNDIANEISSVSEVQRVIQEESSSPSSLELSQPECVEVSAENVSHQSDSMAAYFQEKTKEHLELLRVTRDARKRFPFKNLNDDQGLQAQNYVFSQLPHLFPERRKVLELMRINNKSYQYRKRAWLRNKANQELSDGENVPPKRGTSTHIISESSSVSEVQIQGETSSSSSEIPQRECSEGISNDITSGISPVSEVQRIIQEESSSPSSHELSQPECVELPMNLHDESTSIKAGDTVELLSGQEKVLAKGVVCVLSAVSVPEATAKTKKKQPKKQKSRESTADSSSVLEAFVPVTPSRPKTVAEKATNTKRSAQVKEGEWAAVAYTDTLCVGQKLGESTFDFLEGPNKDGYFTYPAQKDIQKNVNAKFVVGKAKLDIVSSGKRRVHYKCKILNWKSLFEQYCKEFCD